MELFLAYQVELALQDMDSFFIGTCIAIDYERRELLRALDMIPRLGDVYTSMASPQRHRFIVGSISEKTNKLSKPYGMLIAEPEDMEMLNFWYSREMQARQKRPELWG